ncbi:class I SAM-dependent methyltransferase [Desulfosarcina ovata]|uniref:Methyltransferase n=1 Tax=Desulfosarcina ovata subsp. ovata TaxID=2752305 RepID=A0A5K8AM46_9BACT|nr:class I SAM-dependent methyltransferase [Desulfosarcina ovata]BBO92900.1 methyltransferase [Desulfosarcina ovata subsp. ovata]
MITVDFSRLSIRPGDRILDIGCGSGRHTAAAYRLNGVRVTGADLNVEDLKEARARLDFHDRLGEHGDGVWSLAAADVTALPFPDACFDLVICSEVLEHIPDDELAMTEIVRVLKPGKPLVVSVPRYLPERICWALSDDYFNANQGHVRIYRKSALTDRLERTGTRCVGHHYAHSIHAPYWWLKCLVGPTRTDAIAARLYHRLLVWDIMHKPWITRFIDRLLNPILGKSLVIYLIKNSIKKGLDIKVALD